MRAGLWLLPGSTTIPHHDVLQQELERVLFHSFRRYSGCNRKLVLIHRRASLLKDPVGVLTGPK